MIALCTIVKNENRHLKQFLDYYRAVGFDRFIIIDNNDTETIEKAEDIIVIDKRGCKECQITSYNQVYYLYGNQFDWIAFFDADEYLTGINNVKEWLANCTYNAVLINWQVVNNYGVQVDDSINLQYCSIPENWHVKSIVRGGLKRVSFINPHFTNVIKCCNTQFNEIANNWYTKPTNNIRLTHYKYRDFKDKLARGYPDQINQNLNKRIDEFFSIHRLNYNEIKDLPRIEKDISIIIPNRGRDIQPVLDNIKKFFYCYNYEVIVVVQNDKEAFKRGQLLNVGALYAGGKYLVLLDADRLFTDTFFIDYSKGAYIPFTHRQECTKDGIVTSKPVKTPYDFGGCTIISKEDFIASNGFNNSCSGWGYEDRILAKRANLHQKDGILLHISHPSNVDVNTEHANKKTCNDTDGIKNTDVKVDVQRRNNIVFLYVSDFKVIE